MKKKYRMQTGLMICIPCLIAAAASFLLCLADDAPVPYPVSCAVLTFSLTFGLIAARNTDWKHGGR